MGKFWIVESCLNMLFALYNNLVPWTCILQLPVHAEHSNIVYFENSTKNSCNILFKLMTHWKTTAAKVVRDKKRKQKKKRKALNLSVNVFSTKVIIGDTIFTSTTAILRGHASEPRKGLAICSRAKVIPSFFCRSAVKHSTNWANPTTVEIKFK